MLAAAACRSSAQFGAIWTRCGCLPGGYFRSSARCACWKCRRLNDAFSIGRVRRNPVFDCTLRCVIIRCFFVYVSVLTLRTMNDDALISLCSDAVFNHLYDAPVCNMSVVVVFFQSFADRRIHVWESDLRWVVMV